MADRIGHGARSRKILHHHPEYAGQRPVLVAEQYARAVQRAALSARDHVRQCTGAVSASDREIRREEIAARHGLVDGGTTSISLGRTLSRHGRAHRAVLRLSEVLAP